MQTCMLSGGWTAEQILRGLYHSSDYDCWSMILSPLIVIFNSKKHWGILDICLQYLIFKSKAVVVGFMSLDPYLEPKPASLSVWEVAFDWGRSPGNKWHGCHPYRKAERICWSVYLSSASYELISAQDLLFLIFFFFFFPNILHFVSSIDDLETFF